MSPSRAPVVVIGIGNPMRQDDGVGHAAIAAYKRDPIGGCDLVQLDGETTRLLDAWRDRRLAIVIDADSTGATPGTIHDLGADVLFSSLSGRTRASSHSAGLAEAVQLGQALERLPDALRVFGVEPAELAHGSHLSCAVAESLPSLVQLVRSAALADQAASSTGATS